MRTAPDLDERFSAARRVADAVLYEGYVLYPYRASARKNQLRWQFGVVAPPAFAAAEPCSMCTQVIVQADADASVDVRIRALQLQARTVETADGPVALLDTGDRIWTSFDEAIEHTLDIAGVDLAGVVASPRVVPLRWPATEDEETIFDGEAELGRMVRRRAPVEASVRIGAEWCETPGLARLEVTIENTTEWAGDAADSRDAVMRHSLVATHTLIAVDGGRFISALDPPSFAESEVRECTNTGTFPVLIDDDVVLSSPIILYDRPAVAPESQGDMFDSTEIDEILALRVLTLTDDEKREARGTDARSAAVVDRCDAMSPDAFASLHGTFRSIRFNDDGSSGDLPWWEPAVDASFDPWSDTVWIGSVQVGKGTPVTLRPSRRADAQDLFVDGMAATVAGVFHDVDGDVHLAVVVDDDDADLSHGHGRFLYFGPEEVEVRS